MLKKVILSVLFIAASFIISCTEQRFENFGNAIKGLIPEECDECFIVYIHGDDDWLENNDFGFLLDGDYLTGESNFSLFRMSYSQPGDEFYARIDWYQAPLSTPGEGMRYAIINEGLWSQIKQENILYITDAKMTPGVVYEWDFGVNELIATEERTSRIESRPEYPQGGNDGGDNDDDNDETSIPSKPNGTYKTVVYDVGYGVIGQKTLTLSLGSNNTGTGTWTWFRDYRNSTIEENGGTETTTFKVGLRQDPDNPSQLLLKCNQKRVVRSDGYDQIKGCFKYEIPVTFANGGLYVHNGDNDGLYRK